MIDKRVMIDAARNFSHAAHDSINHKRKYSGQPYWTHTDEVASIVSRVTDDPEMIAAAMMHDILEDVTPKNPAFAISHIQYFFGNRVASLVLDLSDEFIKEKYPHLNRAVRKELERQRLDKIHNDSKTIKLADLISNSRDISDHDKGFSLVYMREKALMLPYLIGGDKILFMESVKILKENGYEKYLSFDILATT